MKIISPKHMSKFIYDRFSEGGLKQDHNLLLLDQFHEKARYSITLEEYGLSKEWVIGLSCDLFAEFQFGDVWLVFPKSESSKVDNVFAALRTRLGKLGRQRTPNLCRQHLYCILNELEKELNKNEGMPVTV